MNSNNDLIYGIWLKGKGWLKKDNDPLKVISFSSPLPAEQLAKIFRGDVRYIDPSLIDLEIEIIEAERKTLWHILTNLFKRKNST